MTVTKIRYIIFLFFVGFLFLALNMYAKTGLNYPKDYKNDKNVIGEYQYYNIKTFFGATCTMKKSDGAATSHVPEISTDTDSTASNLPYFNAEFVDDVFFDGIRIDIFNDVLGFLLIATCCFMLLKQQLYFKPAFVFSMIGIILKLTLSSLPFVCNGMLLCNLSMGIGISYIATVIIVIRFATKGFIALLHDTCCRDERIWLNTTWFVSFILFILISLLKWLNLYTLAYFFNVILVFDIIIFYILLKRVDEFISRNCTQ